MKSERAADYAVLQAMLTDERLSRGLTLEQVADRLDRTKSTVWKYEAGEVRLDLVELTALAEAVGFDLLEFVTRFRERTRSR